MAVHRHRGKKAKIEEQKIKYKCCKEFNIILDYLLVCAILKLERWSNSIKDIEVFKKEKLLQ